MAKARADYASPVGPLRITFRANWSRRAHSAARGAPLIMSEISPEYLGPHSFK
jgi:hypothetical protein